MRAELPLWLLAITVVASTAHADPIALRLPIGAGPELVVAAGWPQQSAGVWLTEHLGIAAEVRLPMASVGASLGTRGTLKRGPKGWGLEAFAAGGFLTTLADPGGVLTATVSVRGGVQGKGVDFGVGVAAPAALRVGRGAFPVQAKLPILLEVYAGITIRRVRIGVSAHGGLVLATDAGFGNTVAGTVWLVVPLSSPTG